MPFRLSAHNILKDLQCAVSYTKITDAAVARSAGSQDSRLNFGIISSRAGYYTTAEMS